MVSRQPRSKPAPAPSRTGDWVEDELRDTKARLHKAESELAQALKQTYALDAEVRKIAQALGVTGSVEAAVQGFREELRQVRDQLGRIQDRQGQINGRMEQIQNQRQADLGRERQDLGLAVKQVDAMGKVVEGYDTRVKALEESLRHLEEEVAGGRTGRQSVERTIGEMNTRSGYVHEATLRLEQEASRLATGLDKVEKSEENLTDRMTLFLEQLRRVLERLDKMESVAEFQEEARDAFQKAAHDRELLVQRLGILERLVNDMADRADEFAQTLSRVDQKSQQNTGELLAMAERMQDMADQTKAGLKKVYQVLLRQRRRASEALNQEIKEFTHGELHAGD